MRNKDWFTLNRPNDFSMISLEAGWLWMMWTLRLQYVAQWQRVRLPVPETREVGLIPESGRSPWNRKWQPTPIFLLRKFHGQRSLEGFSPWGRKELNTTEHTCARVHTHTCAHTQHVFQNMVLDHLIQNHLGCLLKEFRFQAPDWEFFLFVLFS